MGATLTFLIRFVLSRSVEQAGWKIGLLYGMNTLGAAIGCALVDLWAVPALGLMHTKMIAVAFECGCRALRPLFVDHDTNHRNCKEPERVDQREPRC
jgi:hypothetical protein